MAIHDRPLAIGFGLEATGACKQTRDSICGTPQLSHKWSPGSSSHRDVRLCIDWISGFWILLGPDGRPVDSASVPELCRFILEWIDRGTGEVVCRRHEHVQLTSKNGKVVPSIRVKVIKGKLYISCNPTNCIQGHNCFAKHDPWDTVERMMAEVLKRARIPNFKLVLARVTRLDLTQLIDCDSSACSIATLRALKVGWSAPYASLSTKENTVYLGEHSHKWSLKAYRKSLPSFPFDSTSMPTEVLPDLSEFLRLELRLLTDGMKSVGLDPSNAQSWDLNNVFTSFLARCRLSLGNLVKGVPINPEGLSSCLKGYLSRWRYGENLSEEMTRPTFHRTRQKLLEYGIDIGIDPIESILETIGPLTWTEICDASRWHITSFALQDVNAARASRTLGT